VTDPRRWLASTRRWRGHARWLVAIAVCAMATAAASSQDVRSRTRPILPSGTHVSQEQADALTLTVGEVSPRLVQTWVRAAATIDSARRVLSADIAGPEAADLKLGQRVLAFPPSSKSSMSQAFVTRLTPATAVKTAPGTPPGTPGTIAGGVHLEASLTSAGCANADVYVLEIVVERGPFLSVPNEAIIEEGDRQVVYRQQQAGQFVPVEIHAGIQGELYTQVVSGVQDGDKVVTFGSFFIDAEHKLKGIAQGTPR
jgi:hypothetical protein